MKIHLFPPAVSVIVKELPPNYGGVAYGPFIKILEKYKDDVGLLKHELVHAGQFWIGGIISLLILAAMYHFNVPVEYWAISGVGLAFHGLAYLISDKYKLWAEVQAYKEQNKHYSDDRSLLFGSYIAKYYKLAITAEDAAELIRK